MGDVFKRSGAKYIALPRNISEGYCLWNRLKQTAVGQALECSNRAPLKETCLAIFTKCRSGRRTKNGYYYSSYTSGLTLCGKAIKNGIMHMIPQFKRPCYKNTNLPLFSQTVNGTTWYRLAPSELLAWLFMSRQKDNVVINDRWGNNSRGANTRLPHATSWVRQRHGS